MTTVISEVYDAFRSAGVPEEKALKAAEALSSDALATKGDMARLEKELAVLKCRSDHGSPRSGPNSPQAVGRLSLDFED